MNMKYNKYINIWIFVIISGLPQRTPLGPLLLIIFTSDFCNVIKYFLYLSFPDKFQISYLLTYSLHESRVLLEKLTVSQLVKNFPAILRNPNAETCSSSYRQISPCFQGI